MEYRRGVIEQNVDDKDEDEGQHRPELNPEISEKVAAERLEEIHHYLRDRFSRRDAIAQTTTKSGQELDWVPIESQTRDGRIASPPSEDRVELGDQKKPADGLELRPFKLTKRQVLIAGVRGGF